MQGVGAPRATRAGLGHGRGAAAVTPWRPFPPRLHPLALPRRTAELSAQMNQTSPPGAKLTADHQQGKKVEAWW